MLSLPSRRPKKPYERILLSRGTGTLAGWFVAVALPVLVYWGPAAWHLPAPGLRNAIIAISLAFFMAHLAIRHLLYQLPSGRSRMLITTYTTLVYIVTATIVSLLHLKLSRGLLLGSYLLALVWLHLEFFVIKKHFKLRLAIIPGGLADELISLPAASSYVLETLDPDNNHYDGIIADFETTTPKTERFLAACALDNVPVYNAKPAYEALTGRVKIDKITQNSIGSLAPSNAYLLLKSLTDRVVVVATLPLTLPLMLLLALLIRLESPGPAIFMQERIGKGNQPFTMYKFRSMAFDPNDLTENFTNEDDPRITRLGKILRPLRLDELPQLLNVLKGEMSLIGPRPEQPGFVKELEQEIPFYSYRHVIKPGITGWAQVQSGYAATVDANRTKVEFDFYYLKNCSITLDFFIFLLTIRTMLTGFGAR